MQRSEPVSETLPEPSLVETAAGRADSEPAPLDDVRGLAVGLPRATGELLSVLSNHATEVVGWVGDVMGKLARTAGWILDAAGGEPDPHAPYAPLDVPSPAAPPPAPLPMVGTSLAGASSYDGSNASADAFEKLLGQFAVLAPLSSSLLQGGGRPWFSREALRPSSAPRPPNDRPG